MAVLSITFGSLDKAGANEFHKLVKGVATSLRTEEGTYPKEWVNGKGGDRDPSCGAPAYYVHAKAEDAEIRKALAEFDPHLGRAWGEGKPAAATASGRAWWART